MIARKPHTHSVWFGVAGMVAVLLLGFATRIIGSDYALWTDEGWTLWFTEPGGFADVYGRLDRHPPLYFYGLLMWRNLAGMSPVTLRFLSMAMGVISVALVYRITVDVFGRRAGLYAAVLMSALPMAVYYGQEIRHYGALTMMSLVTIWLFLRYLRQPTLWRGLPYAVAVALLMYTNYLGAFTMLIQAVGGVLLWRGDLRQKARLVVLWFGALVLYLPWMLTGLSAQYGFMAVGIGGLPGTFETTPDNLLLLLNILTSGQTALIGGLYLVGVWALKPRFEQWFMVLAGGGLLVLLVIVNTQYGLLSARALAFVLPPLLIVCGAALMTLPHRIAVFLVVASLLTSLLLPTITKPRTSIHDLTATLATHYNPGDLIVLETGYDDMAFEYEIERALPDADALQTVWLWDAVSVRVALADDIANASRVWAINWVHAPTIITDLRADSAFVEVQTHPILNTQNPLRLRLDDFMDMALFIRPDNAAVTFGESVRMVDAVVSNRISAGDRLFVDTFWQAGGDITLDYSTAVFLQAPDGRVVAQVDGRPTETPTNAWQDDTLYYKRHTLEIPADLPVGAYQLSLRVYYFETPEQPLIVAGEQTHNIGTVDITD